MWDILSLPGPGSVGPRHRGSIQVRALRGPAGQDLAQSCFQLENGLPVSGTHTPRHPCAPRSLIIPVCGTDPALSCNHIGRTRSERSRAHVKRRFPLNFTSLLPVLLLQGYSSLALILRSSVFRHQPTRGAEVPPGPPAKRAPVDTELHR